MMPVRFWRPAAALLITAGALSLPLAHADEAPTPDKALEQCPVAAYAMALRYQQQSAEVQALQRQSYQLATYRLKEALEAHQDGQPLAIITDLDETVIDNSALLARDLNACHDYSGWDTWGHWEREGQPDLIPGARDFLNAADQRGVAIYYISDRLEENKPHTLETLKALGLPQIDNEHVLLLGPPKQQRRASVTKHHDVIMQLGDTLHDFSEGFADKTLAQEHQAVKAHAGRFGHDWIMLPNATYGNWSEARLKGWQASLETE